MLNGVVLAAHRSACKHAEDVLTTLSSDLLAEIGPGMAGIGVTVMGTGVTQARVGLIVVGIWCDGCRDWRTMTGTDLTMTEICSTVAVVQTCPTGRGIWYKATNAKGPDRKFSCSRHFSDLRVVRAGSQNQVGHTEN